MSNKLLLYKNPKKKTKDKCEDELSTKLGEYILKAQKQHADFSRNPFSLNKSDVIWGVASEKHFERGITTMGVHKCSCGASSDSYDVLLPGGYITNTLGSHYLIYHRGEIPISQIRILEKILK